MQNTQSMNHCPVNNPYAVINKMINIKQNSGKKKRKEIEDSLP